jgi:signal transduction histidine kinase/ligand-binding sensor domain-containing protein
VRALAQTPDGYLWATTFDGLVRFDGVRFTEFNQSNTKGLRNNRFTCLTVHPDGSLWAGADDGTLTIYRDGVFTSYGLGESHPNNQLIGFKPRPDGPILIWAKRGHYYFQDGKFVAAPATYELPNVAPYWGPSGTQWHFAADGVTENRRGQLTHYPLKLDLVQNSPGQALAFDLKPLEDQRGALWFSDYQTLYRLHAGQITRYSLRAEPQLAGTSMLRPFCTDNEGGIWFAAGRMYQKSNGVLRFYQNRFTWYGAETALRSTFVSMIFKDREGTLWVGANNGLHRLQKRVITTYSESDGLPSNEVYPLLQARNGDLWIGTAQGLSRYRQGRFSTLPLRNQTGDLDTIHALGEDATGRIWLSAQYRWYWFEQDKLKDVSHLPGMTLLAFAFHCDRNGHIWVATDHGIFRFHGDRLIAHYTTQAGLPSLNVKVILEDRRGTLWFGTYGGLAQFKDNQFTIWTTAQGLAGNRVRSLYEDQDGTLWIGTYDQGLSRFRDGQFFNYRVEQGLFNNGVFQILEDQRGYFWIGCNRGIYRVRRTELNQLAEGAIKQVNGLVFGKQDGLLSVECNGGRQPAGLKTADGKLWFPTQGGIVVIEPEQATLNTLPPPVYIETIRLEGRPLPHSAMQQNITLVPGEDDLEISFTGLSFLKSEQLKFRYKLEGLEPNWIEAGTRRTVYYPFLPPGDYLFQVIGANSDGVWNSEGAQLRITVVTPFRERWWVRLGTAFFLLFVTWLIFKARITRLKQQRTQQELFARRLIESQESERKRIAAELHDSLGQNLLLIKNSALVGLNALPADHPTRQHLADISDKTSLALDEVRQIAHNLRPYQLERFGLTAALEHMMRQVKTSSDIDFITRIDDVDGLFPQEAEVSIYRIVQECVNNVIKHSEASEAWLQIKRTQGGLQIMCTDNGKGFDPKAAAQASASGFGLTGIAERVHLLGGNFVLQATPGHGAKVSILIEATEALS